MYMFVDSKPNNCSEIYKLACGKLVIMINLKLVNIKSHNEFNHLYHDIYGLLRGTNIFKGFVETW